MNPKVDVFLSKANKRQEELEKLRMIILACELTEELKWGVPCYAFQTLFFCTQAIQNSGVEG
jgi:uncharacterized protein YdeI (YjbR/CyaY-like superfamily)